jgi:hypothetical protein
MPEVIRKTVDPKPGFNIGVTLNRKATKGEIGIEIEFEGKNLLHGEEGETVVGSWVYTIDHSLRGEENAEYILRKPVMFSEVPAALKTLWNGLEENKAVLDDSNRTSVHLHLNAQEFHMNRLTTFLAAWFSLEEILVKWCGNYREGNLFCLRAVDAPALITHLKAFIKADGAYQISDLLRYGALNPNALFKYGSIELRPLRGCNDMETIQQWVDVAERLYRLSEKYDDPRDLVALFSSGGPSSFFETLLGPMAPVVRGGISLSQQEISQAMFRGIRFAQDLAYSRDWNAYKAMRLKSDPFGRDARKIVKKLSDTNPQPMSATLWDQYQSYLNSVNQLQTLTAAAEAEIEPLQF